MMFAVIRDDPREPVETDDEYDDMIVDLFVTLEQAMEYRENALKTAEPGVEYRVKQVSVKVALDDWNDPFSAAGDDGDSV